MIKLENPKILHPNEAAYLAGLIDGDGHLGLGTHMKPRKRGNVRPLVPAMQISSADKDFLLRVQDLVGGAGRISTNGKPKGRARRCFCLYFRVPEQRHFLPQIIPYLIYKKPQASLLLERLAMTEIPSVRRQRSPEYIKRRDEIYHELRLLNKDGAKGDPVVPNPKKTVASLGTA